MTKKSNNTRLANFTLGGIALGFLLSYPFQASFVGGLIASGCRAGLIGGLADWFAVTALFRRPLRIRPGKIIRTEIIPQNRERIFRALADMVQHELLSPEVLRNKLAVLDFSAVLTRLWRTPEIERSVRTFLADLAENMDKTFVERDSRQIVSGLLQENILNLNLSVLLAEIIEFSLARGEDEPLLQAVCDAVEEYVEQPEVKAELMLMIEDALTRYGENNFVRILVARSLPEPSVLAHTIQNKLKTALRDGTVKQMFKDYLLRFGSEIKTNLSLQERCNAVLINLLQQSLEYLDKQENEAAANNLLGQILGKVINNWDDYLGRLESDPSLQLRVADRIRLFLERQIASRHEVIGRMILEGLAPLTDDKLVELLEDKAGNDLQMIRINGSLVGSLVGMLIYLVGMVFR